MPKLTKKEEEYIFIGCDKIASKKLLQDGLAFTNELGNMIQPRNFVHNFKAVLKAAGLEKMHFHDIQRTYALLSLQQGVDIKTLQSDLGHKRIETTLDRYMHINVEMKKDAANKSSGILKGLM